MWFARHKFLHAHVRLTMHSGPEADYTLRLLNCDSSWTRKLSSFASFFKPV